MDTEQQPADLDPYFPFLSCSTIYIEYGMTYYYICSDKRTPSVLSALESCCTQNGQTFKGY